MPVPRESSLLREVAATSAGVVVSFPRFDSIRALPWNTLANGSAALKPALMAALCSGAFYKTSYPPSRRLRTISSNTEHSFG